jgi:hypothetical protein
MSQTVRCDICNGLYNQRYLSAHKRLSHARTGTLAPSIVSELDALQEILCLYARLSDTTQKEVRDRLTTLSRKVR